MAIFSGKDGSVTFATGYETKVFDWTVDAAAEAVDITALGDKWTQTQGGAKSWSGTFNAHFDNSAVATVATVGGSTAFGLGQPAASATFYWEGGTSTAADGLEGDIIITGASVTAAVGGESTRIAFTFTGTGDLNLTTT